MILNPLRSRTPKRKNSSINTVTNVTSGKVKAGSGLPSSKKVPASMFRRRSSLAALSLVKFQLAGTPVDMESPMISLRKLTVSLFGHWLLLSRLSTLRVLPIPMSFTSICTLQMSVLLLVAEWVVRLAWVKCSRIAATRKKFRMTFFKKRMYFVVVLSNLSLINSILSFINTTAGWINLLLLSSSGPVKIPVGAWYVHFCIKIHNFF